MTARPAVASRAIRSFSGGWKRKALPALLVIVALVSDGRSFARDEADIGREQEEWEAAMAEPIAWELLTILEATSRNGPLKRDEDGTLSVAAKLAAREEYRVDFRARLRRITAVRVEFFPAAATGGSKPAAGRAQLSEIRMTASGLNERALSEMRFGAGSADSTRLGSGVERAVDGDLATAWAMDAAAPGPCAAVFELREPIEIHDAVLTFRIHQAREDARKFTRFRITVTSRRPPVRELPQVVREALALEPSERTDAQRRALRACFLSQRGLKSKGRK